MTEEEAKALKPGDRVKEASGSFATVRHSTEQGFEYKYDIARLLIARCGLSIIGGIAFWCDAANWEKVT